MGELTKRIVWVHINEIREIPITEQYSAYVKLKDFEEMHQECKIPNMPFIPPYVIEQSNIPKAKELSEWIREVHQIKINLKKWFGDDE